MARAGLTTTNLDVIQRLTLALQDMADAVMEIERNCPCGARIESPVTHPHAAGCPVVRALTIWQEAFTDA